MPRSRCLVRCGQQPIVGVSPSGTGDLSMYLAVAVDPETAPARTDRAVATALTAGWRDHLGDALNAYVDRTSVRVTSWTVDYGDGTTQTYPGGGSSIPDDLTTTHAYDAGSFDVVATAHVVGSAFGAFFTPDGDPFERTVPFSIDISNVASGVALPIEYIPPVVTVGVTPTGNTPAGPAAADTVGHDAIWWPRGLPCDLVVLPVIETEGVMRSGGVVIGGARTTLVTYRLRRGTNDAADATKPGSYEAADPIRIQWNTPLPGRDTYPVELTLELSTRYDDGTVRTSAVNGTVEVTIEYSAVGG